MREKEKKLGIEAAQEVDFISARVGPTSTVCCSKDTPANEHPKGP